MRWIDPHGGGFSRWLGRLLDEAFGIGAEGVIEGPLSGGVDIVGLAVVDLVGRHETDPGMVVVLIVPGEEAAAEVLGVLNAAEARGEFGLVFEGLEVGFGERVVVGGVWPAMRLGDAEIGQHQGGGLGFHGAAAVSMEGQLARRHGVLGEGVLEQRLEQDGAFGIGDAPADDPAAEDVEDDVEIEVRSVMLMPSLVCLLGAVDAINRASLQFRETGEGVVGIREQEAVGGRVADNGDCPVANAPFDPIA